MQTPAEKGPANNTLKVLTALNQFDDENKEIEYLLKSDLAEAMVLLKGKVISYTDYPIQKEVMNCDSHEILYFGGRQISKSTLEGVDIIIDCILHEWLSTLYVAPELNQVKEFSTMKLKAIIEKSPQVQEYIDSSCLTNVFEKSFTTNSRVVLRAISQEIRGIEAMKIREDEIQDATIDELRLIEIVLDGQKEWWKFRAGTAKTLNNPIEYYRKRSKQMVPVLKCPECSYHNIPSLDNIKPDGLKCKKCKGAFLSVRQPYLTMQCIANKDNDAVSFWVPQIALPLHVEDKTKWREVYRKFTEYPTEQFLNEVMGISAGSAYGLITEEDLVKCCKNNNGIDSFEIKENLPTNLGFNLYMGIDWGLTQFVSFTVVSICGYNPLTKRFTVIYMEMVLNPDPDYQVERCFHLARKFGVSVVIPDAGSGFDRNFELKKMLSIFKVPVYPMYNVKQKEVIRWDEVEENYKIDRTKSLTDTFKAIRKTKIHFFSWDRFKYFAPHFLAEYIEWGKDKNGNPTVKYDHDPDNPDDSLHSVNVVRTYLKHIMPANTV